MTTNGICSRRLKCGTIIFSNGYGDRHCAFRRIARFEIYYGSQCQQDTEFILHLQHGGYYKARDIYVYADDPTVRSATKFGRMRVGEYNQAQYGGAFSLGRQVERLGNITAEYRLEATHIASLSGVSPDTKNSPCRHSPSIQPLILRTSFPSPPLDR